MPSRIPLSAEAKSSGRPRRAAASSVDSAIAAKIVAVRPASERGRAELIRDVVDAYRRLYGSVQRFVQTLTGAPQGPGVVSGVSGAPSLNQLLSILADEADAAGLARLRDLKAAIGEARSADQLRDAIFSDALSNDLAALRKVVAALDRLDAAFIGLSVEHVLEQHARASRTESTFSVLAASGR